MPEKTLEGDHRKPCTQSSGSISMLQQRETVGEATADEDEEEEQEEREEQQEDTEDKEERVGMISVWCVERRKRMMWTLKTVWHVVFTVDTF